MRQRTPLRQIVLCPAELHGRFRFSMSRLQRPALWVISQPSAVAKSATLLDCLMPGRATWALSLFFVQAPAPNSLGHKPTQRRGKERHSSGLSYARQSYMGAFAFLFTHSVSAVPRGGFFPKLSSAVHPKTR